MRTRSGSLRREVMKTRVSLKRKKARILQAARWPDIARFLCATSSGLQNGISSVQEQSCHIVQRPRYFDTATDLSQQAPFLPAFHMDVRPRWWRLSEARARIM